jgi:hypothetical protein
MSFVILFAACIASGLIFYMYRSDRGKTPNGWSNVGAYIKKHGGEKENG